MLIASGKKTKADIAQEKLEASIISCELEPGSVMTEAELADFTGLGRTPVREALLKLANENLVRLSRAGVVIPELNPMTVLKLLEPRALIEALCIEKAVERITEAEKELIVAILEGLRGLPSSDRQGFIVLLRQMHHLLAQSAKNEFILNSIKTTQGLSRRFWFYYATDDDQAFSIQVYIRQMEALYNQDASNARQASADLMNYLTEFAKKQLNQYAGDNSAL